LPHAGEQRTENASKQYLAASGAVPISVTERGTIHTGSKIAGTVARWWITAADAPRVASAARTFAGPAPDLSTATATATAEMLKRGMMFRLDAMLE
jgi:hypothetical protein